MVRVGDNQVEEAEVCGGNNVVKSWLVLVKLIILPRDNHTELQKTNYIKHTQKMKKTDSEVYISTSTVSNINMSMNQ